MLPVVITKSQCIWLIRQVSQRVWRQRVVIFAPWSQEQNFVTLHPPRTGCYVCGVVWYVDSSECFRMQLCLAVGCTFLQINHESEWNGIRSHDCGKTTHSEIDSRPGFCGRVLESPYMYALLSVANPPTTGQPVSSNPMNKGGNGSRSFCPVPSFFCQREWFLDGALASADTGVCRMCIRSDSHVTSCYSWATCSRALETTANY